MKITSPAALRNREPILGVLKQELPASGLVLEVASGSGEHAVFFSEALPQLQWQPTDGDPAALASIDAYLSDGGPSNMLRPLALDVTGITWPVVDAAAVFCANLVHISPWAAAEGLFAGAARVLSSGARLILYGPFRFQGRFLAETNAAFDRSLRARDPSWGIREIDALTELAGSSGLSAPDVVSMPANNHCLLFKKL